MEEYKISLSDTFYDEMLNCPRKIQKSFKNCKDTLRTSPANGPNIKKLKGLKNFWRIKISDSYRLVYSIDLGGKEVVLLKIGPRQSIYDAIGFNPQHGPSTELLATAPEIIEENDLKIDDQSYIFYQQEKANHSPDKLLPFPLTKEWLENINIPDSYIAKFLECKTEEDLLLLESSVDKMYLERVIAAIYPKTIVDVLESPRRDLPIEDFDGLLEGHVSLDSLLLRLDKEQKEFVDRFSAKQSGPWLLKGGPGSGKSTVAIYCINEILCPRQASLFGDDKKNILFCTYTNALAKATAQLMRSLSRSEFLNEVCINTFDGYIWRLNGNREKRSLSVFEMSRRIMSIISAGKYSFSQTDAQYLADEFEWVIYGNGIESYEAYQALERIGRGRSLKDSQRREVWDIFIKFESKLDKNETTYKRFVNETFYTAVDMTPKFDYIFIDEAQDLTPQAIRLCIAMCKNPSNVFITADINQSIYGAGFSWNKIHGSLKVTGKTKILRKNYRTTKEIMLAALDITTNINDKDVETLKDQFVKRGDSPVYFKASNQAEEIARIKKYIHESAMDLRITYGNVAVLCSTKNICLEFETKLQDFNAKFFDGRHLDLNHNGIKIMTMHSAKGLQFPIVIIPRLTSQFLNYSDREIDFIDRKKKLLFVAFSRAMNKLLVTSLALSECSLMSTVSDDHWDIEC